MANRNPFRDSKGKFTHGPEGKPLPAEIRRRKTESEKRRRREDPTYRDKQRERLRKYHYVRSYGMSFEQVIKLRESQGNNCACCGKPLPIETAVSWYRGYVVDHDHKTGRVRGIIHQYCNRAIAALGDDLLGVESAYNYLRQANDLTVDQVEEHW